MRLKPDKELARQFLEFAESEKKARSIAGITLGAEITTAAASAGTGAATGAVAGPIGIAAGAIAGFFSGLFGGDGELGPPTEGVVNPETGKTVHCGKPDETARTQLLAQGDTGWVRARMGPGDITYRAGGNPPLPFPDARPSERDKVDANIFAELHNEGRGTPGECPDMIRVAGEQLARLKLKIARAVAKPEMFSSIDAYNRFMGITSQADQYAKNRALIGQAQSLTGQIGYLEQASGTLAPQDQALVGSLVQSRGIVSSASQAMGGAISGDPYAADRMRDVSRDVSHLTSVVEGLRNPTVDNRRDAKESLDELGSSSTPLLIAGGLGLFGLITLVMLTRKN